MKILLTGFWGAGKSSVAPHLAKHLGYEYIEMDTIILKNSGRSNIVEIFDLDGEDQFRRLEEECAKQLIKEDNIVISTGGGIGVNKKILDQFKTNSKVVFLSATIKTSLMRIKGDTQRPLRRKIKEAEALYNTRLPLYKKYADIIIETDNKSVEQVTDEIVEKINL